MRSLASQRRVEIKIEDIPVFVEFSRKSLEKMAETTGYEAASLVLKLGERILDMKPATQFLVIDKELGIGILCEVSAVDKDIYIDVITAVDNADIYISRGIKIFNINALWEAS